MLLVSIWHYRKYSAGSWFVYLLSGDVWGLRMVLQWVERDVDVVWFLQR